MTVRAFMMGTLATMVLSWGILALIVLWVDPLSSTASLAFVLFFLSIFLAVSSVAALVGYAMRSLFLRNQLPAYRVRPALRQGVFLGVFVDLLLFLQLQRILVWWVSAIIVLLFIVIELVFISYDKYSASNQGTGEKGA